MAKKQMIHMQTGKNYPDTENKDKAQKSLYKRKLHENTWFW